MRIFSRHAFSGNAKRLSGNLISLSSTHVVYNVLSLLTVPYLTRILGPSNFGLVGFVMALMTCITVLTDYGFSLSATNRIACNRENAREVSDIFSAVISVKLLLGALSFALLCGLVVFVDKFNAHLPLYFIFFLGVVGNILFPAWLFQGFESMRYPSYIHIVTKVLSTAAVFCCVKTPADTITLAWIYSLTNLVAGVLGIVVAYRTFDVHFAFPALARISAQLVEGRHVFLSSAGTLLYTSSTAFILGLFSSHEVVGYFTGADKIRVAIQGLFTPLFQTVYPYVSNLAKHSRQKARDFMKIEAAVLALAGMIICATLVIFADGIVSLGLGKAYANSAEILKIMSIIPALFLLGNVLSVQYLLSMGLQKEYLKVFTASSAVGLVCVIAFTHYAGARGTVVAMVVAELTALGLTLGTIRATRTFPTKAHGTSG